MAALRCPLPTAHLIAGAYDELEALLRGPGETFSDEERRQLMTAAALLPLRDLQVWM